jgi:transcriptional regulator with XRE-family HTH domain
MRIEEYKKKLGKENPGLELEFKKNLAFQVCLQLEMARLIKGLTQKELAEKAGTKQSNIARAESGAYLPSLSFLKRIADALDTYLIPPKFAFVEKKQNISSPQTIKVPTKKLRAINYK